MKLIDLLVKELPSRGGWPTNCYQAAQDDDGKICFFTQGEIHRNFTKTTWTIPRGSNAQLCTGVSYQTWTCEDANKAIVTCEQYEAAIAPRLISTGLHSASHAQFCAAGWTDEQLIEYGYFRVANAGEKSIELPGLSCEVVPQPVKGVKHDSGKFRFSLLPWNAVKEVIDVLEFGAKKYAADNWKYVDDHRDRYFNATIRHVTAWYDGEKNDPETGFNHLAHAVCCLLFLIWFDKNEQK